MLRQPNRRHKVSRAVGDARCVAEWTNVIKVRRLAEHFLGHDLSTKMMQVDEKPIHMNESGSKAVKTLELEGAPSVSLRTNHSASRERVTIMTSAFSDWRLAMAARKPPIAACIKAESPARATAVTLPAYTNFSLDWTRSGSYDRVHFLSYLECWLEKWTPRGPQRRTTAYSSSMLPRVISGKRSRHMFGSVVTSCFTITVAPRP